MRTCPELVASSMLALAVAALLSVITCAAQVAHASVGVLVAQAVLDPRLASHVAAWAVGEPAIGPALVRVCDRESDCTIVGVHRGDARWSSWAWQTAIGSGRIDPTCQPYHAGWSTRGAWGTMAAFTVVHLPGSCWPAWVLDVPLVGAIAAARRALHPDCRRYAACRRWRGW